MMTIYLKKHVCYCLLFFVYSSNMHLIDLSDMEPGNPCAKVHSATGFRSQDGHGLAKNMIIGWRGLGGIGDPQQVGNSVEIDDPPKRFMEAISVTESSASTADCSVFAVRAMGYHCQTAIYP